jgi:hypothetical protein
MTNRNNNNVAHLLELLSNHNQTTHGYNMDIMDNITPQ